PIGSQTYPHRQRIKDGDFAGLCRDMSALGIGIIELCSPAYEEFASLTDAKLTRKIIEDHGLTCPSAHFELSELRNALPQAIPSPTSRSIQDGSLRCICRGWI